MCAISVWRPEPAKRPIQRARKPGHAILFIGPRRASPLIRGVEQPHARKIKRRRDLRDLGNIWRAGALQRATRKQIERRHNGSAARGKNRKQASRSARARRRFAAREAVDRLRGYRQEGCAFSGTVIATTHTFHDRLNVGFGVCVHVASASLRQGPGSGRATPRRDAHESAAIKALGAGCAGCSIAPMKTTTARHYRIANNHDQQ